jgi:hypothetical protein
VKSALGSVVSARETHVSGRASVKQASVLTIGTFGDAIFPNDVMVSAVTTLFGQKELSLAEPRFCFGWAGFCFT